MELRLYSFSKKRNIIRISITAAILVFLCLVGFIIYTTVKNASKTDDKVVAEVNAEKIVSSEFIPYIKAAGAAYHPLPGESKTGEASKTILINALDSAIKTRIQVQEAKKQGLNLTDADVKIAAENAAKDGLMVPLDEYSKKYYEDLALCQKLQNKIISQKSKYVNNTDIQTFYDKYKDQLYTENPKFNIDEIYISYEDHNGSALPQNELDKAKTRAQDVLNKVNSGESFENLAKQYSDDTNTKAKGGIAGPLEIHEFDGAISELLPNLNVGEVKTVETKSGFYIIKLLNKSDLRVKPLEEIKNQVVFNIIESQPGNSYKDLIDKWVAGATIVKHYDVVRNIDINKIK